MSNNAVVRRGDQGDAPVGIIPRTMGDLETIGRACVASGFFADAKDAAQAMIKIQAGSELGLAPIQSMTGINVIKGRITLSAGLMAALIKRAGYKLRVRWEPQPLCCIVSLYEGNDLLGDSSFSVEDAKQAGLSGDNWRKYPRNMLYARAVSNAARWYTPEVLTGCYLPDELEDAPPIEIQPAPPRNPPTPTPTTAPATVDAIVSDPNRSGAMRKLHAVAKGRGLNHDDLREAMAAESIGDLSTDALDGAAMLLECISLTQLASVWAHVGTPELASLKDWCKGDLA